jgi:hypothetical protein
MSEQRKVTQNLTGPAHRLIGDDTNFIADIADSIQRRE